MLFQAVVHLKCMSAEKTVLSL